MRIKPIHAHFVSVLKRIVLSLAFLLNFYVGFAQYGTLDDSFGSGGEISGGYNGYYNQPYTIIQQPDGKILVGGEMSFDDGATYTQEIFISRYNPDGSPDISFGNGGSDTTYFPQAENGGCSITLQANGKIIVAGTGKGDLVLIRYLNNGQLDNTFGENGIVSFSIMVVSTPEIKSLPDGNIIISATILRNGYGSMIMRCDSFGTPDILFGKNGVVNFNDLGNILYNKAMAVQCDGKILIAASNGGNGVPNAFSVVRFNPDGSPDNSFGTKGIVITNMANSSALDYTSIGIKSDGKIVTTGYIMNSEHVFTTVVVQYNTNGSPDSSFGSNGILLTNFLYGNGIPLSLIIQPDQKILIGGQSGCSYPFEGIAFAMDRFNTDGTPDNTFGVNGQVANIFGQGTCMAMQSDGKILMAGFTYFQDNFVVSRYISGLNNGPLDTCSYPGFPDSDGNIAVPNAFTPNGDNKNDTFYVLHSTPINSFSLHIYDRWGQMVYSSTNIEQGWDGTYGGIPQSEGIYLWTVCAQEDESAPVVCKEGKLTLIR